ncbi:2-hydroxychromene-2-carboxylate isomerase/DsbA-like thioredoxin domain [Gracilibacillus boraciitolerans JCM 21714]|uniref:2-hydroxychromene-2-carboxylate isomerase/DsbA-like thioredoxin domain n=1 Tax=Gracilibacillus boraciitolerans JCM 21714 TaxID=1298598 RepID=W4VP82_9BACI|nr:DsbA family oxidoreductase [Gracilibacillus boraciitolerans]GAE95195.1 2-hydroxychromene-2-carboxylate isomerase/DsbA-like thioredoxin domain [Gracilibacillus boraciitolerans JCM 21714]
MQIEIWSDFVCPFCYIGKQRLEQALERFPEKINVSIQYKSFELDPNAPNYSGVSIHEALAKKYNMTIEQAKQANKQISEQAKSVGLNFVFDTMKPGNTFLAHRISKYAASINREADYIDTVLYHYFTLSKDLSDPDTLRSITKEMGLNQNEINKIIETETLYDEEVRNDESEAQQLGITGVPFFVINKKYAISGAQLSTHLCKQLKRYQKKNKMN